MSTINDNKRSTTLPVSREDLHSLRPLKIIDEQGSTDSEDESSDQLSKDQLRKEHPSHLDSAEVSSRIPDPVSKQPAFNHTSSPVSRLGKHGRFPVKVKKAEGPQAKENIWREYQRFWESDQAGLAIIAHDHTVDHNLVAIKEVKQNVGDRQIKQLRNVSHDNVVRLLDVFISASSLHLVYESLHTSLHNVQATARGELTEIDLAIIGKEILEGLKYIHNELGITHGQIDSRNILLCHNTCRVKLANIGNCVLKQENGRKSDDVQAVGALLVSLKEPGTSGRKPGTLHLERPHDVSDLCNDFMRQCATSSSEALLQHDFLLKFPGVGRMRLFIYKALECAKKNPLPFSTSLK